MPKVNINKDLFQRAKSFAEAKGYSSIDEFVEHVIEEAVSEDQALSAEDEKALSERLKGLGYIE